MDMQISIRKWKTEVQAVFLNPFTVSSSCANGSFSVCPFVDEETDGSPFANRLNRQNGLGGRVHLWKTHMPIYVCTVLQLQYVKIKLKVIPDKV